MIHTVVYVLYRYWDSPDSEGSDVLGVFQNVDDAISYMKSEAEDVKSYYPEDYWEPDMTWEDDAEIHLGRDSHTRYELATIYCWTISKMEVK